MVSIAAIILSYVLSLSLFPFPPFLLSPSSQDIIVRLYFILGNLTSTNTSFSYTLYHTHKFHQSINKTLSYYYESMNSNQTDTTSDVTNSLKTTVDVLIKV